VQLEKHLGHFGDFRVFIDFVSMFMHF